MRIAYAMRGSNDRVSGTRMVQYCTHPELGG